MAIQTHQLNGVKIAEIIATDLVIQNTEDGLDWLANLYYQDYDGVIVHQEAITPAFFDLKSGLAGELLQTFANFRVRLAIVGDFTPYTSTSLRAFIAESNQAGQVNFVSSVAEAVSRLATS